MNHLEIARRQEGLSSFALKLIAIAAMLCDHIGAVFYPEYLLLRVVGRLTMPVMCFLICEGVQKTHNFKRYLTRLIVFALISEIPFDLAFGTGLFDPAQQNVMFTLALGALAVECYVRFPGSRLRILFPVGCMFLAQLLATDYGSVGVLMVFLFHIWRGRDYEVWLPITLTAAVFVVPNVIAVLFSGLYPISMLPEAVIQVFSLVSVPLLGAYNGRRGGERFPAASKYLFYVFYPLHLLIIGIVQ